MEIQNIKMQLGERWNMSKNSVLWALSIDKDVEHLAKSSVYYCRHHMGSTTISLPINITEGKYTKMLALFISDW